MSNGSLAGLGTRIVRWPFFGGGYGLAVHQPPLDHAWLVTAFPRWSPASNTWRSVGFSIQSWVHVVTAESDTFPSCEYWETAFCSHNSYLHSWFLRLKVGGNLLMYMCNHFQHLWTNMNWSLLTTLRLPNHYEPLCTSLIHFTCRTCITCRNIPFS